MLKALKLLPDCEVHLVVTEGAVKNYECETDLTVQDVCALADVVHLSLIHIYMYRRRPAQR